MLKSPLKKSLKPSLLNKFIKPHHWIVCLYHDGRTLAHLLKTKKDLPYFKQRPDIKSSVLVTAFNKSEAWHKGKVLLEK